MSNYLGIVVIIMIVWQLIIIGWHGWIGLQTILGVKKRRSTDISNLNLEPPSKTQEIITSLNSLGFRRLGEAQSALPYNNFVTVWTLVNIENTVQAEVVFGWMSFSTYFQDNVLVVTDYPSGEHIEMPKYQSHTITSNISDTYQHHLEQVDKFRQLYGSPNPIRNMADYIKWETIGRINYGSIKLKNFYIFNIIRLITFGYAVAICIAIPLIYRSIYPSFTFTDSYNSQAHIELLIIGLTYPAIFFPTWFSRWQDRRVNKKTNQPFQKPA